MTTKQRAYLKSLANSEEVLFQVGKSGITPELTEAVADALEARELVKVGVLKNCAEDVRESADTLAQRTRSQVVQVIGRKFILYKQAKDEKKRKIVLPS